LPETLECSDAILEVAAFDEITLGNDSGVATDR